MDRTEDIKTIADYYGILHQLSKLTEECAEVIQEVARMQTGKGDVKHLIEELADVEIMKEQIIYLCDGENQLKLWRDYKLDRQIQRIKEEKAISGKEKRNG